MFTYDQTASPYAAAGGLQDENERRTGLWMKQHDLEVPEGQVSVESPIPHRVYFRLPIVGPLFCQAGRVAHHLSA